MTVTQIINGVLEREKGYVNNPKDRGGPTNWGITEATARNAGYTGDMKDLPRLLAYEILVHKYYVQPKFDTIAHFSTTLAEAITDAGVLCGQATVSKWLQRVLNVLNREGKLYQDIDADGKIGPGTIVALSTFLKARGKEGELVLLRGFNHLLGNHFISISETRPANEEFTYGWLLHRSNIN
jgi:lysozyme family protein